MTAYYNDNDPFAAAWLRELIKAGLIALGEVDERSIEEVKTDDLRGFTQCHFFAGIGVWSYALRLAGWPDDRPVWTGSCPCPSFSAAGQGKGFEDPRHLWPRWFGLIRESRPATIFGEQADKAIGFGWLDLVQTNLEAEGYAVGATVFGAHSVGAPHIRQRLYFVADSDRRRLQERWSEGAFSHRHPDADGWDAGTEGLQRSGQHGLRAEDRQPCERADSEHRRQANEESGPESRSDNGIGIDANGSGSFAGQQTGEGVGHRSTVEPTGSTFDGEYSEGERRRGRQDHEDERRRKFASPDRSKASDGLDAFQSRLQGHAGNVGEWRGPGWLDPLTARSVAQAGATRGYWGDCDWWFGRDGKYRPIGAGLFPLVNGATGRMGKLRGYGNAICAPQAQAFIEAYMSL